MLQTKKTIVMFLLSAILGGGAWYLNTTGVMSGLSSSIFGKTFICSPENLTNQAAEYRKTVIQLRRALAYREDIETKIQSLRDAGQTAEMKQQQAALRTLIRSIGAYNRFVKAYQACKNPTLPIMVSSGEVTTVDVAAVNQSIMSSETIPVVPPASIINNSPSIAPSTIEVFVSTTPEITPSPEITATPEEITVIPTSSPETTEAVIPETTQSLQDTSLPTSPETTSPEVTDDRITPQGVSPETTSEMV